MEVFEYYKSFEHKIYKGKYMGFFLWLAGIAVGDSNRKVYLFSMRNLPLKNKYFLRFQHWVERIFGFTSNSLELNDSGDQAVDSQQQEAEETIPESSTSRYGQKRTRVLREKLCAMA